MLELRSVFSLVASRSAGSRHRGFLASGEDLALFLAGSRETWICANCGQGTVCCPGGETDDEESFDVAHNTSAAR